VRWRARGARPVAGKKRAGMASRRVETLFVVASGGEEIRSFATLGPGWPLNKHGRNHHISTNRARLLEGAQNPVVQPESLRPSRRRLEFSCTSDYVRLLDVLILAFCLARMGCRPLSEEAKRVDQAPNLAINIGCCACIAAGSAAPTKRPDREVAVRPPLCLLILPPLFSQRWGRQKKGR